MRKIFVITAVLIPFFPVNSQEIIEDNSFLLEEAYNQGDRDVQHILNVEFPDIEDTDAEYSFSQEWPLFSSLHQLSYDIPFSSDGIGSVKLQYRYQLSGKNQWAASAPAVAVMLPAGDGDAGTGFELLLPVSKRLSRYWVMHVNAGFTIFPSAAISTTMGEMKKSADYYFAGGSLIWLFLPKFNFIVEYLFDYFSEFDDDGAKTYGREHTLSPGLRFAIDINDLQIVPGAAVPYKFKSKERELFLYLSLEHDF